ncbi:hypothetical protein IMG5_031040 [Ichthyophthirius multifiliis]|uniref:EF-hand domain-containing protein n=1 Tax=Ichthyophthirius multifiliis TaxID=5932 RepID=G0QLI6_ICHMU|nr:hypothetical protein IMG5_031040 [Ichthyophthirius multifiliis]EGR33920.1 hypothetical protein IMG5_031040 [Ichthyophthirius multifiliis]|eukprot:XP_004039224.1 hypothetical protein IMG5_031040 [Ichthyophthirius multifiliis]
MNSSTMRSSSNRPINGFCTIDGAKAVAKRFFEDYDKGNKQRLDNVDVCPIIIEVYKAFNQFYTPSGEDVKSYHRVLDGNGDGQVTYQDIEDICIRYLCGGQSQENREVIKRAAKPRYTPEVEQRLNVARRLFKRFDTDGSGQLKENEIANLLVATYEEMGIKGVTVSAEDVEIWLDMADSNRDGGVSLEEYEQVVIKSLIKMGIKVENEQMVI